MNARRGFTLMEVLLATSLSVVLLLSLWSVFGAYVRMFEMGQEKTLRAQVLRGLMRQIADDLRSAIQDAADAPAGSLGSSRRFGMFGTARDLQFDMLQPVPVSDSMAASAAAGALAETPPASQAYELHTVRYSFRPLADVDEKGQPAQPGLVRQEFDFQAAADTAGKQSSDAPSDQFSWTDPTQSDPSLSDSRDNGPPDELSILGQTALSADDDAVTWVPEVAAIEFRYFDGTSWSSVWSSLQRRALPVAVEVVIQLVADTPSTPQTASNTPADTAANTLPDGTTDPDILKFDDRSASMPKGTMCRMLINLPKSALRRDFASTDTTVAAAGSGSADDGTMSATAANAAPDGNNPGIDNAMALGNLDPSAMPMRSPDGSADDGNNQAHNFFFRGRRPTPQLDPAAQPLAPDVWMRRP